MHGTPTPRQENRGNVSAPEAFIRSFFILLCGLTFCINAQASDESSDCYWFPLEEKNEATPFGEPPLGWMTSGFLGGEEPSPDSRQNNRLLLVDIPSERIANVPFDLQRLQPEGSIHSGIIRNGNNLDSIELVAGGERHTVGLPRYIHTISNDRFLLLNRTYEGEWLSIIAASDDNYRSLITHRISGSDWENATPESQLERRFSMGEERLIEVRALRRVAPMASGFLAYASARPDEYSDDARWMAFAYLEIDDNKKTYYQFGDPVKQGTTAFEYHIREFQLLTTIGKHGFILEMKLNLTPRIGRVTVGEPEITTLEYFPIGFSVPPAERPEETMSPRSKVIEWMYIFYKNIEQNAMPLGIYSWDNRLFVLAKEGMIGEETIWYLIEVSPTDGSELNRIQLPTSAPFILLLPGDPHFGLVELSTVHLIGSFPQYALYRRAESTVLFPENWLESDNVGSSRRQDCQRIY